MTDTLQLATLRPLYCSGASCSPETHKLERAAYERMRRAILGY